MNRVLMESGLAFNFIDCVSAEKYDEHVPFGLSSVDFMVETNDCLYELLAEQRLKVFNRIIGHIPTGLNDATFSYFTNIVFDMPEMSETGKYGFTVTTQKQESSEA